MKSGLQHRNLGEELAAVRRSQGLHQSVVARRAHLAESTVQLLEATGGGRVATLVSYLKAVHVEIDGLPSAGKPLEMRLREARGARDIDEVAQASKLDRRTVQALEAASGQINSLLALLHGLRRDLVLTPQKSQRYGRTVHGRDHRFTPAEYASRLIPIFGDIGLDPCAHPESPTSQLALKTITETEDGLVGEWSCPAGSFVWLNPPFSNTRAFGLKALEEWRAGRAPVVVMLIRMAWDTLLFQQELSQVADNYALQERPVFLGPSGQKLGINRRSPLPLAFHILGASREQASQIAVAYRCVHYPPLALRAAA